MVLDFFFIFTILFATYNGYYKGFSHIFLSFIIFLVSVAVALFAFDFVNDLFMETKFAKDLFNNISSTVEYDLEKIEDDAIENVPYLSSLYKTDSDESILEFSNLSDSIAEKAIRSLISIPIILLVFLLTKFFIKLIRVIVIRAVSLPIISGTDSFLGSICGLLMGIVLVGIMYSVMSFLQFIPDFYALKHQFNTSAFVLLINDFIF